MTDTDAVLRAFVVAQAGVTALVGTRVHASDKLPAGYSPVTNGPAILLKVRGGQQDFPGKTLYPSYQFECYAATEALARQVSNALFDAINHKASGLIKQIRLEVMPVLLTDPDTGWPFVLSYYKTVFGNP